MKAIRLRLSHRPRHYYFTPISSGELGYRGSPSTRDEARNGVGLLIRPLKFNILEVRIRVFH